MASLSLVPVLASAVVVAFVSRLSALAVWVAVWDLVKGLELEPLLADLFMVRTAQLSLPNVEEKRLKVFVSRGGFLKS